VSPDTPQRRRAGFSYIEVLVATLVVALLLVPALEALESGIRGVGIAETESRQHHHLRGKLEEVLAESLTALELEAMASAGAPSAYSDAAGAPDRRLVYLWSYDGDDADGDGDPLTGGDPGLVLVAVEIAETTHQLATLAGP